MLRGFDRFLLVIFATLFFVSCAEDKGSKSPAAPKKEVAPAAQVAASFSVGANSAIQIHKDALDKEFLLRSQLITQTGAPQFGGLKSRVVAFSLKNGRIYLLEASAGHVVTEDLPSNLVLASFPTQVDGDYYVIDFNRGMAKLFTADDWRGQDFSSGASNEFNGHNVSVSFIESASLTSRNELFIRQIAQFNMSRTLMAEIRYYLSPYNPDPTFQTKASYGFDRFGFFEVAPYSTLDGGEVIHASKFHEGKPIVFAVSSNTPPAFRQAVIDGILYWNKAFGRNIIQAIDAPAGLSAPHPDYNIVQWVNWDRAGFAYADAQMDPRTGQILNAQVYFTSAFAFVSKRRARALLRSIKAESARGAIIEMRGFGHSKLCDREQEATLLSGLEHILSSSEVTDETVLKISQNYIREVVAHEVGHTLGLRHNFAGSLATNYRAEDRPQMMQEFLANGGADSDWVTSSSVMEYQLFFESIVSGDLIAKQEHALSYDEKVIRNLYLGEEYANEQIPSYCTDSHVESFADCNRFDYGNSVSESVKQSGLDVVEGIPSNVIEEFITGKTVGFGLPAQTVHEVHLSPQKFAVGMLAERANFYSLISQKLQVLEVRRRYEDIGEINDEVKNISHNELMQDIESLGGFNAVAFLPESELVATWSQTFEELIDSGVYDRGVGPGESDFAFTEAEKTIIKQRSLALFPKIYESALSLHLEQMDEGLKDLPEHPLSDKVAEVLFAQAKEILLAETGEFIEVELPKKVEVVEGEEAEESVETITVELPLFKHTYENRKKALQLLKSSRGKSLIWGIAEREEIKKLVKSTRSDRLESVKMDDVNLGELAPEAALWLLETSKLAAAAKSL
ncbi:MAG: hypothetical protein CL677_04965 [Bdellovibrionaceae bacterium]|nr:hypothetical protein [Pseudobdellovibrionaceae bacterium]|tara:strand:- start:194941 stop:197493 length:2553 start_codon:yes stop_codon:yes gene_type:complete